MRSEASLPLAPENNVALPPPTVRPRRTLARVPVLWWVTLGIIALDQVTKTAVRNLLPLHAAKPVIPGVLDLIHVQNAGVAFGLMNDFAHPRRGLLTLGLALAALVGIGYYARQLQRTERLARVGLSLILGGAVGNLIDRMRDGYVVDFVDVYWRDWHFWAFNVADAAISVGAVLVFLELLRGNRHASHPV
jgi:signal peptidase II